MGRDELERHGGREESAAGPATGDQSTKLDRVHSHALAVRAVVPVSAGRPGEREVVRTTVTASPFRNDIGDDHAVVLGGELHRHAGGGAMSLRCIHGSRVRMVSIR